MVVCMSFLSPTQPSDDDEYASSSSSLLSSTASSSSSSSSSYTNSTATTISGYTHNLNPTKTSNPVAQDLFDASRVVQILNSMKRDPKTAISFFDRLKEQGFAALVRILCYWGLDRKLDAVFLEVIVGSRSLVFCRTCLENGVHFFILFIFDWLRSRSYLSTCFYLIVSFNL